MLQGEIIGQLNGQMVDMIGGVETVGEEPEPESEDTPEQHKEEEEEELTKASSFNWNCPNPWALVSAAES